MEDEIKKSLLSVALAVTSIVLVGTFGYHLIEGWSLFDSFYMTVITIATVGYGETHPLTVAGRVFTILVIFFGIGILTYAISTMTAFVVEGRLKDVLRRRRMEAKISKLSDHYIVCGAGHTGQTIIDELLRTKRPFVIVEKDPERADELQSKGLLVLEGDATDDELLMRAGIQRAKGLFGALPSDPNNAFVSITAKGLNPTIRIVCRAHDLRCAEKLRRSGADVVVNPHSIGGLRMASEMIRPAVVSFLDSMMRAQHQVLRIEEVKVPEDSPLCGTLLEKVKGSQGGAALVLAIKDVAGGTYQPNPKPEHVIEAGQVLVAMGTVDEIKTLAGKVGASSN